MYSIIIIIIQFHFMMINQSIALLHYWLLYFICWWVDGLSRLILTYRFTGLVGYWKYALDDVLNWRDNNQYHCKMMRPCYAYPLLFVVSWAIRVWLWMVPSKQLVQKEMMIFSVVDVNPWFPRDWVGACLLSWVKIIAWPVLFDFLSAK